MKIEIVEASDSRIDYLVYYILNDMWGLSKNGLNIWCWHENDGWCLSFRGGPDIWCWQNGWCLCTLPAEVIKFANLIKK